MGLIHHIAAAVLAQRGHLFPWVPVCLAFGIGGYFVLRFEPTVWTLIGLGVSGCAGVVLYLRSQAWFAPFIALISLMALGFGLAGIRAHWVAGPVLDFRYYGAIEGRIVGIDRSASDAVRLTLDRVVLERMDPAETPRRVRVSLHGQQGFAPLEPDAVVILTGHLGAPGGAVEPGGFDFRRHAWFLKLGAVGYTRNPVLLLEQPAGAQAVFATRMTLSRYVQKKLPGETGAFAAAVMTGDRSGMGQDTLQALRDTNLAHLLAISGLHMGLLAGFVFGALRVGLLLVPQVRHRWPVKRIAAAGALLAAFCYLLLSGGNVATERAFVMAAVALTAVMLHRRALSLRAVALAAMIILFMHPEALLSPGFQMSFAATTALVAVFAASSEARLGQGWPGWGKWVFSLVVSSAVAGVATAPVGMAHFNQVAHYGLVANLVSVPVMGVLVVPMGVMAALLMPIGLDWIAFAVMGLGLDWILWVADTVEAWPGAVRPVPAPGRYVLALLAFGGLILCLWHGRGRLAGFVPALAAVGLWLVAERPPVLVADKGALVGVMTAEGRALSKPKGAGFVASVWLENDGSAHDQIEAAALWPDGASRVQRKALGTGEIVHLQGKRAAEAFRECRAGQIVIASTELSLDGPCTVYDPARLAQTGSLAIWPEAGGARIITARQMSGHRLWHGLPLQPETRLAQRGQ